jgi:CspA family cold shock protein
MTGRVARITTDKGYGFIKNDAGGKDLFFHHSALMNMKFVDLREGAQVTFEIAETEKGPRAEDIYVS